jgi:uncharacterized protein YceH (UPF0502 family)
MRSQRRAGRWRGICKRAKVCGYLIDESLGLRFPADGVTADLHGRLKATMTDTASAMAPSPESPAAPKWRPLSSVERRIAGVLVEKAKTTPDAYPMTLNALVTGCNQKNNREPQMSLTPEAVESALESLRLAGALTEVQGAGRVPKYRHFLYEWLGVDKYEMAVMAELLLRGEQTIGELRGRAARMEPIAGVEELKPILKSLLAKNLIVALTPEGRGQVVTHNLYKEREIKEIQAHYASGAAQASAAEDGDAPVVPTRQQRTSSRPDEIEELRREIAALREELASVRDDVARLKG